MVARKLRVPPPKSMPQAWKDKIQAGMLAKRLQDHVKGIVKLETSQVRAAEILLRKTVPDLAAVQVSGDPDMPHKIEIRWKSG